MNDKMNSRCVCKGAAVLACIKLCNYLPWSMDIIEWTDSWNILAWAGIKSKQLESDFNVFFSFKKCCALCCNYQVSQLVPTRNMLFSVVSHLMMEHFAVCILHHISPLQPTFLCTVSIFGFWLVARSTKFSLC